MIANLRPTMNHFCANVDLSVCPTKISGPLLGLGRRGGRLGPMSLGNPKIFSSNSKSCFLVPALAAYRPIALALLLPYRCAVPTLLPKAQAARTCYSAATTCALTWFYLDPFRLHPLHADQQAITIRPRQTAGRG
jgi:hypothetical protein